MRSPPVLSKHPPLAFALVGLAGWKGARWVEFFPGELGRPVESMWLGHGEEERLIIVCTARKKGEDLVRADKSGPLDFVRDGIFSLVDCARPRELRDEERSCYDQRVWDFATEASADWSRWEPAVWWLDGSPLSVRIFRFAHAWAGFTVVDPGRYVSVTAYGPTGTGLHLAEVDGTMYGWDFTKPFGIADLSAHQSGRRPEVETVMRADSVTADHRRVLLAEPTI